jgi:hypothetical protein
MTGWDGEGGGLPNPVIHPIPTISEQFCEFWLQWLNE